MLSKGYQNFDFFSQNLVDICEWYTGTLGVEYHNPAWISKHISSEEWKEDIIRFPNFNGGAVEFWKWMKNFIPHFIMDIIHDTIIKANPGE